MMRNGREHSFIFYLLLAIICGYSATNRVSANAAEPASTIVINTTGHQTGLVRIASHPNKKLIFSVGTDKTLKIWDAKSTDLIKTVYLPREKGVEGELFAIDVSPTEPIVIVGGATNTINKEDKISSSAYIVNWATEKIQNTIGPLEGYISNISAYQHKDYILINTRESYKSIKHWTGSDIEHTYIVNRQTLSVTNHYQGPTSIDSAILKNGNLLILKSATTNTQTVYENYKTIAENQTATSSPASKPKMVRSVFVEGEPKLLELRDANFKLLASTPIDNSIDIEDLDGITYIDNQINISGKSTKNYFFEFPTLKPTGSTKKSTPPKNQFAVMSKAETLTEGHMSYGDGLRLAISDDKKRIQIRYGHGPRSGLTNNNSEQFFHITEIDLVDPHVSEGIVSNSFYSSKILFADNSECLTIPKKYRKRTLLFDADYCLYSGQEDGSFGLTNKASGTTWEHINESELLTATLVPNSSLIIMLFKNGVLEWRNKENGGLVFSTLILNEGKDWIYWTPDGTYDSSPGGDTFLGLIENTGKTRLPKFHHAGQTEKSKYNPKSIKDYQDSMYAKPTIGKTGPPPTRRDDLPSVIINAKHAGEIGSSSSRNIEFTIESHRANITSYHVFANNIPILHAQTNKKNQLQQTVKVNLFDEATILRIEAFNDVGMTMASTPIFIDRQVDVKKGKLYLISIGVNIFEDAPHLNLNFAARDSKAFARLFTRSHSSESKAGEPQFSDVLVQEVNDFSEVSPSKENILKSLELISQAKPEDTIIIFLASHGVLDENDYYFLPADVDNSDIESLKDKGVKSYPSLISWQYFYDSLRLALGKRILVVDTCHAKGISGSESLRSLAKRSLSSSFALLAASDSNEVSEEVADQAQGLFTLALINSFNQNSDKNNNGKLELGELFSESSKFVINYPNKKASQNPQLNAPRNLLSESLHRVELANIEEHKLFPDSDIRKDLESKGINSKIQW